MPQKNIEQLQQEIKQALIYFEFWDQHRGKLPNATQTADYFSGRLYKLRKELEEHESKRQCCDDTRETRKRSTT
jgi:hypothetical protein